MSGEEKSRIKIERLSNELDHDEHLRAVALQFALNRQDAGAGGSASNWGGGESDLHRAERFEYFIRHGAVEIKGKVAEGLQQKWFRRGFEDGRRIGWEEERTGNRYAGEAVPCIATHEEAKARAEREFLADHPQFAHVPQRMADLLSWGWTIIANAGGGNWETQTTEWQEAAAKWRDEAVPVFTPYEAEKARDSEDHQEARAVVGTE